MVMITESRVCVMEAVDGSSSRFRVQYITPGFGSSGYYSAAVLESAATAERFPTGTPLYVDHPSMTDRSDRPERSVRDMGAVSVTPGVWNPDTQAVEAEVEVYPHYAWLGPMVKDIGLSIRASAEMTEGTVEGRRTKIVDELVEVMSVDFVTRAGRGGKVLEAIESARITLDEATSQDRRDQIERAAKAELGGAGKYVWVRDFDEGSATAYLQVSTEDGEATYSQAYSVAEDDLSVSLSGDAAEVRVVTNYVPVSINVTEGGTVPKIEDITEANAKVETLEADLRKERELREAAEAREARSKRGNEVRSIATAKLDGLPAPMVTRLVESVLAATDLSADVDKAKVETAAESAHQSELAYLATIGGQVKITGHGTGATETAKHVTREQADEARREAFNRKSTKITEG